MPDVGWATRVIQKILQSVTISVQKLIVKRKENLVSNQYKQPSLY